MGNLPGQFTGLSLFEVAMTDITFSRTDPHDQRVPVLLTADEYLFARDESERRGVSISAYFRSLLNVDRRHVALGELSINQRYEESAEPAHDMNSTLRNLARLLKAYQ